MKYEKPSDVLVLGGGFAGMYAAIAADRAGASVTILCKSKTGGSGNSVVAMSVHRFPPDAPGLRAEYRERFLRSGAGQQNAEAVEYYLTHAAGAMEALRAMGLPLEYRTLSENGREYPYLACCHPKQGRILTAALRSYLDSRTHVSCADGITALDIVRENSRACGVVALHGGETVLYPASAVILACGGAGRIYSATSNTSDVTGDGYAMAARCGLSMQNMEFVQFYPYRINSPARADIFPDIFEHGAVFRNERGERFMDKPEYPKKELENRDVVARAMYFEKQVRLDLTDCDQTYLEYECPNIHAICRTHPGEPLLLHPVAHFLMGGVPLRPDCSTQTEGLFVCGETSGGLHGANRLAGSALTEAVLFGRTAGESAARYASEHPGAAPSGEAVRAVTAQYPPLGDDDVRALRDALRKTMWENASVVRTEESLRRAEKELQAIREQLQAVRPRDLREWNELRSLLYTSAEVVSAAKRRRESLGAHYRIS